MRIVINGWFLVHDPYTGSGQYVRALLEWLPRVAPEHDYHVVLPGAAASIVQLPEAVSTHTAPVAATHVGKLQFEQATFPSVCKTLGASLAHVPYWAPPLRSPAPIVVTVHDLIPLLLPEYRGSRKVQVYTSLVAAATAGAALVLTDSHASARDIVQHLKLPEERVRAIHLAAGPHYTPKGEWQVDDPIRAGYGIEQEGYVLYLGGFDTRKNVRGLLSAWTWASGSIGQGYPLILAGQLPAPGSPHYADYLALAQELDIADTVRFIGPVAEAHKPALYRGATAFVYPSRYEGFGLPLLEAMACGVPVVAGSGASLPEVVGSAGYLIPPDDTRAIGAALLTIVVEPSVHADLRARSLAQAQTFSWERTARETALAYASVAP